jgi:hypothetical protein
MQVQKISIEGMRNMKRLIGAGVCLCGEIDAIQVPVRPGLTADIGGRWLNTNGEGVSEKLDASRRSVSSEYRGMKFGTKRSERFVEFKCK